MRLREYLVSNERIIEHFAPVVFQGERYYCAVTNFRILIYHKYEVKFTEIEHSHISSISLEGGKAKTLGAGIACLSIGIGFLILTPLLMFISLILGICSIGAGVGLIIYHLLKSRYYVRIGGMGEVFELYSTRDLLQKLVLVIRNIRHGGTQVVDRPTVDIIVRQEPPQITSINRNLKLCVHCGTPIRDVAVYCDNCGKTQESIEPEILNNIPEDKKYCTFCGSDLRALALFCDKCGKTLEAPEPENQTRGSSNSNSKFCVFCGSVIPVSAIYCEKCGRRLEELEPEIF